MMSRTVLLSWILLVFLSPIIVSAQTGGTTPPGLPPPPVLPPSLVVPAPGSPTWPWWHSWNPYHPDYPHPTTNPFRIGADAIKYGQVVGYIEVAPRQVVVNVYVAGPGSFSGGFEPQLFEIPGYVVTETTTGYLYPARAGLQEITLGVFNWVTEPPGFQPK